MQNPRLMRQMSLKTKLRLFTFSILLPLGVLAGLLLLMMSTYNNQYSMIVRNVTGASEFSMDFKRTLDYKMYRYIIGGCKNFEQYAPFDDINAARAIVDRLKESTTRQDSLTRLRYITHFLNNLEKYIDRARQGLSYDVGIANLENNIYVLTELITDEMHNYIYYETRELADLQQRTNAEITRTIFLTGYVTAALIIALWIVALITSNSITKPIKSVIENIRMVGEGDFTVRPVTSSSDEIRTLSAAFDNMVRRISELMDDLRSKQENLRRTELQLLQAQINPHFLYNTFDTIIWLAEDNQTKQVVEITTSLSNYFRTTLSRGRDFITLREEETHVKSYLEIQQVRYRDILTYEIDIPDELRGCTLPKLSLQPLVENALYHGIKYKRGLGNIKVSARRGKGVTTLEVRDNGVGMDEERLKTVNTAIQRQQSGQSFGCANVHERIRLYYGEPYGLKLESVPEGGIRAVVTMP